MPAIKPSWAVTLQTPAPSSFAGSISESLSVSLFHFPLCDCVKKGEEIRERRKKKEMKRKVKGAWGNEKERERRK
jgi:hypothetical protein